MLILCRLLAARLPHATAVTVVVTEEWHSLLGGAAASPPGVRLRTIPNVIPSENGRAADFTSFLEAVYAKLGAPFELLLDALEAPATAIISDTYLPWAVAVGIRRGIPVCSLLTMSATFFSALLWFDRLPFAGDRRLPVCLAGDSGADDELLAKYIPGHSSIRLSDLGLLQALGKPLQLALEAISQAAKAECLMVITAYELEPRIIDAFCSLLPFPVYHIGPIIPCISPQASSSKNSSHGEDYLSWLNSQPESSVLYVSLGSFLSVSRSRMDEIALGLLASNVKFLWLLVAILRGCRRWSVATAVARWCHGVSS